MKRTRVVGFHGRRLSLRGSHLAVGKQAIPPVSGTGDRWFDSSRPDLRGRGAAVLASLMSSRPWVRIPPALLHADAEHRRAPRAVTPTPPAVVVRLHPSALHRSTRPRQLLEGGQHVDFALEHVASRSPAPQRTWLRSGSSVPRPSVSGDTSSGAARSCSAHCWRRSSSAAAGPAPSIS